MATAVVASEQQTVEQAVESSWCAWINILTPWERRFVLANELEFHDLYASGEWGWADLNNALLEHFKP